MIPSERRGRDNSNVGSLKEPRWNCCHLNRLTLEAYPHPTRKRGSGLVGGNRDWKLDARVTGRSLEDRKMAKLNWKKFSINDRLQRNKDIELKENWIRWKKEKFGITSKNKVVPQVKK